MWVYLVIGFCILCYALAILIVCSLQNIKTFNYFDVLLVLFSPIWVGLLLIDFIFHLISDR